MLFLIRIGVTRASRVSWIKIDSELYWVSINDSVPAHLSKLHIIPGYQSFQDVYTKRLATFTVAYSCFVTVDEELMYFCVLLLFMEIDISVAVDREWIKTVREILYIFSARSKLRMKMDPTVGVWIMGNQNRT